MHRYGARCDVHRLLVFAELEVEIEPAVLVDQEHEVVARRRLETGGGDNDVVTSQVEEGKRVDALLY